MKRLNTLINTLLKLEFNQQEIHKSVTSYFLNNKNISHKYELCSSFKETHMFVHKILHQLL